MLRSISEMAATIRLHISGRSSIQAVDGDRPQHIPVIKIRMTLDQKILVASEATPGLLPSCFLSSAVANAG